MLHKVIIETERQVLGEGAAFIKLGLPRLEGEVGGAFGKSFAAYIEGIRKGFLRYVNGTLLPAAAVRGGGPPYGGALNTVPCHRGEGVLSLYVDATVTDGRGRRMHRLPLLWDERLGVLIDPRRLFVKGAKRRLIALVTEAMEKKSAALSLPLYSDSAAIARRRFDIERFYLSPSGGVFFYQGGTLNDRPEPYALPLPFEELCPLLKDGVRERLWGGGEQ